MQTRQQYIYLLQQQIDKLKADYGVTSLSLFGSVARNEQNEGSDVDVFVEMPPRLFLIISVKQYLEAVLDCKVDVVRNHKSINPYLLNEIAQDGIMIF